MSFSWYRFDGGGRSGDLAAYRIRAAPGRWDGSPGWFGLDSRRPLPARERTPTDKVRAKWLCNFLLSNRLDLRPSEGRRFESRRSD